MSAEQIKYAYSFNDEDWSCTFDSREEAINEAFSERPEQDACWIGKCSTPKPEDFVDGDYLIDHIECQDEFSGEHAEQINATKEQVEELTGILSKVIAEWIDRHGLRPTFFNVDSSAKVENPAFQ